MRTETISKITLTDNNELLLILIGKGDPAYQYVYREAAGVYWDNHLKGFKSTSLKEWTISKWYSHIRDIALNSAQVYLRIDENTAWENIPDEEITKIKNIAGNSARNGK